MTTADTEIVRRLQLSTEWPDQTTFAVEGRQVWITTRRDHRFWKFQLDLVYLRSAMRLSELAVLARNGLIKRMLREDGY